MLKGFAFIDFTNSSSAQKALQIKTMDLDGRTLVIEEKKSKNENQGNDKPKRGNSSDKFKQNEKEFSNRKAY